MKSRQSLRSERREFHFEPLEVRQLFAADVVGDCVADQPASEFAPTASTPSIAAADAPSLAAAISASDQAVTLPADSPEQFTTTVEFAGETLTLELSRNREFENTRFLTDDGVGGLVEFDLDGNRAYLGAVVGKPDYRVSAVLTDEGLLAIINRPGEGAIVVEPMAFSAGIDGPAAALALAATDGNQTHRVYDVPYVEPDYSGNHDHDGDGIPDHAAEDHVDETGGGHPPGCSCSACCGATSDTVAASAQALDPAAAPTRTLAAAANDSEGEVAPATLPPTRVLDVLEYEIGVEIGSAALQNNYSGSNTAQRVTSALAVIQGLPGNLDARFLHAAGIQHRLGTVIIRTGEATVTSSGDPVTVVGGTDQFTVSNGNDGAGLNAFRDYWNNLQNNEGIAPTHDLAVYHVRSAPSGLAFVTSVGGSNRYALSASNGPTSWADGTLAHEFGHSWSLPHTTQGMNSGIFYENRPRNNNGATTAGGIDFFISPMNGSGNHNIGRFATDEANRIFNIREGRRQFGDLIANPDPIKPFGHRDDVTVGDSAVVIDVIANDYDFNNDVLDAQLLDTVSFQGGSISLSAGTGPGGRNEIIYTPPSGFSGDDFFHYTVVDSTGRTDFGAVHVTVENPEVTVNLNLDSYAYDFGTVDSPIFSDANVQAVRITPDTFGDINWSGVVQAVDRPDSGQNAYNRDLVFASADTTWSHKIANGIWQVTVNMSDPNVALDNLFVEAEGLPGLSDIDRPIGTNTTVSFNTTVTDGVLDLTFGDADTSNSLWALNRVVLTQIEAFEDPLLDGDYNQDGLVSAADYTVWRDTEGASTAPFEEADGNGSGFVDAPDQQIWADQFGAELITTTLIDATNGNGDFTDLTPNSGGTNINLGGGRVLASSGVSGAEVTIPGWVITRNQYQGGNDAFGFDGVGPLGSNGSGGQTVDPVAFVNNDTATLRSDGSTAFSFSAGDAVVLSYDLGTDTADAAFGGATVQATLTFNEGQAGEFTETFSTRTATFAEGQVRFTETVRLTQAASSVSVEFALGQFNSSGPGVQRVLFDNVELQVASPTQVNAAQASVEPLIDPAAVVTDVETAPEVDPPAADTQPQFFVLPSLLPTAPQPSTAVATVEQQTAFADLDLLNLYTAANDVGVTEEDEPIASSESEEIDPNAQAIEDLATTGLELI